MRIISNEKLPNPFHRYVCPRCGETYSCATEDEIFDVGTHRLLHMAGALKRSMPAAAPHWLAEAKSV